MYVIISHQSLPGKDFTVGTKHIALISVKRVRKYRTVKTKSTLNRLRLILNKVLYYVLSDNSSTLACQYISY